MKANTSLAEIRQIHMQMKTTNKYLKKLSLPFLVAAVLSGSLAARETAAESDPLCRYLDSCQEKIAHCWLNESLDKYKIPPHFRLYAKGVVTFSIDSKGRACRIRIKHSSKESLVVAARLRYGARGDALLAALDKSMLEAVTNSCPLPGLPKLFESHPRYAAVFDPQRFQPLKLFIDDDIPVRQGLSTGKLVVN